MDDNKKIVSWLVRGCKSKPDNAVEFVSSEDADFWGVYALLGNGDISWVGDIVYESIAHKFAELMNAMLDYKPDAEDCK